MEICTQHISILDALLKQEYVVSLAYHASKLLGMLTKSPKIIGMDIIMIGMDIITMKNTKKKNYTSLVS